MLCVLASACAHLPPSHTRADFLQLIDRPRVPLAPEVTELSPTNNVGVSHFSFATEAGQRVPGLLWRESNSVGRRPVVIVLHGTGGSKEGMAGLCYRYATNGFIAIAIDGRHNGERMKAGKGATEYDAAIMRAYYDRREYPLFYDTVWDVMRLVDYLQTRTDVDAKRIGLIGISKGGTETYLAAAADKRIAVAVPCIGVQSFGWALEHNAWQGRIESFKPAFDQVVKVEGATPDAVFMKKFYDRVAPGLCEEFDGPMMLPLIAPRALLVINSDLDKRSPLPGVWRCIEAAEKSYITAKAQDHFAVSIQANTGHKVTAESEDKAMEWFVKWLKP